MFYVRVVSCVGVLFFFQAEDGIRDLVRSRGLGDVYKRQAHGIGILPLHGQGALVEFQRLRLVAELQAGLRIACLLYTSDAADERSSVDLGGRRIIKKKKDSSIDGWHEIYKNWR